MSVITASQAQGITLNSKTGFMQVIDHVVHNEASAGKNHAHVTIPQALHDMQNDIRSDLEAAGYEVLIEVRQGCCMPTEHVLYLNWSSV